MRTMRRCGHAGAWCQCANLHPLLQIKSMNFEAWAHAFFASVRDRHPALFNSSFDGLQQTVSQRLWQLLLLP
jgi:hypothetical protein